MNRRRFLASIIKGFFTGAAVVYTSFVFAFLYPSRLREKVVRFIPVLEEDALPRRGVKTVLFSYPFRKHQVHTRAFIVRHRGELFALSPVCTHLGCMVNWHRGKGQFLCPCHGGKYDIEGRVVGGPPPRPLSRLPLRVEKGKVLIGVKV